MWSLRNRGFTLVEVMIAAAILAVIVTILYGAFAGSIKTMEISSEEGDIYRRARIVLNHMTQEISCAYLPTQDSHDKEEKEEITDIITDIQYAFIGEDRAEDDLPRDTLSFTTTALPLKGPSHGLKEVGYYLAPDPETEEPALLMREDTTPDDRIDEGGTSHLLAEGIWGIDVTYYDERGREWNRWDSTSTIFLGKIPRSVRIALLFKDEQGEPMSLTATAHIVMGGGGE
jgi:prepilin-type N-terminal cleavage/methylation domain-containing protein